MDKRKKTVLSCSVWIGIILLYLLSFRLHRFTPFMMDDIWYGTNLATGEPLGSLWDVVEGQVWHFMNWGGRSVTHGVLQLTIMSGEFMADLLNLLFTMLLSMVICIMADAKKPAWFLLSSVMVFAFNANMHNSMFWQAGVVNYVYSTAWILLYLWMYMRMLENPERKNPPGILFWMPILGLMTGWSNENMGPSAMVTTLGITAYLWAKKHKRPRAWMIEGIGFSFAGSLLVILAPGNFQRASTIENGGWKDVFYRQMISMLTATAEYLFPVLAFTLLVWLVYCFAYGERFDAPQIALVSVAVLAHGAMGISPHYPDRATFGVMVVCVLLSISMLVRIFRKNPRTFFWMGICGAVLWIRSMILMLEIMV